MKKITFTATLFLAIISNVASASPLTNVVVPHAYTMTVTNQGIPFFPSFPGRPTNSALFIQFQPGVGIGLFTYTAQCSPISCVYSTPFGTPTYTPITAISVGQTEQLRIVITKGPSWDPSLMSLEEYSVQVETPKQPDSYYYGIDYQAIDPHFLPSYMSILTASGNGFYYVSPWYSSYSWG